MATRNDDFQRYDRKLSRSMALGSLREALLSSDVRTVEAAVENCEKLGLSEDPKVEETRNSHLPILVAKEELQIACERRDRDSIEACLEKMEESGVAHSNRLFVEMNKARILLDLLSEQHRLQQQHRRQTQALELDRKALSEMRRYHKPPQLLHRIVQAALLLLGENEDQTDDWRYCQRLCNPQGRNSLSRRLTQFQPETVHEEIVARAKQILSERDRELDLEKVETIGAGTGLAFYVWARAAIEKAESARKTAQQKEQRGQQKKGQMNPAVVQPPIEPANRKRQKVLLLSRLNASGNTTSSNGSSVKVVAPATDRRTRTDHSQQPGDRTSEHSNYSRTPGDGRYRFQ